ncbi:acetylcholinesterase, partial [Calliphora vicina]|uniref:acetylcholinesterase n=1 Tax=Calliphora vicina TaxID=7373 RepID=UPI00325A4F85
LIYYFFQLKVFPDSARSAIYAFLGVPYAEPPIEELRFAPPKVHSGWNRTLLAMSMRPICPQLSNTIYDEAATDELLARPSEINEDCLYLNIWVSESGLRYGNLPVLVILTGEGMSYDWPRNRITGLDIAAEGFVVITVQYRTNIFGWLNVPGNIELRGNYGLQDQSLALKWIKENVKSLGGNSNQITLLGHGTSGAPCAFYHSLINNEMLHSSSPPFNQMILMSSGNIERALQPQMSVQEASKIIVEKLGCQFEEYSKQLMMCLRSKSVSDLLKAFESIYDHGNGTFQLGPSLSTNLKDMFSNSSIMNSFPTTIIGITSNEGAFMQDYWLELARDSYTSLKSYINYTLLRNVLSSQNQLNSSGSKHGLDAINWRYFADDLEENPVHLLAALQRFISEYNYEIPFYRLLNVLSNATESQNNNKLYAYINDFTNSMDIRGKINLFGGSSHTSDLPLLFGPTLFQQIARRRFNAEEEKVYRKIRTPFINFIKNGNPTPVRIHEGWLPYTTKNKYIYDLGDMWSGVKDDSTLLDSKSVQKITQLLVKDQSASSTHSRPNRNEFSNSYQMPKNNNLAPTKTTRIRSSPYTAHLMRVYGFWEVFLPEAISKEYALRTDDTAITQHLLFMEASADAARFKHGFFVMLGLVLLLLTLLCLCVYLLRRDPLSSPQFDCDL